MRSPKLFYITVCVFLPYFIGNISWAYPLGSECVPLKQCPPFLELFQTRVSSLEIENLLRLSHCGFDNQNQPKVRCSKLNFCVTPQNEIGTCTPLMKCMPFLQLREKLDTTNPQVRSFLNKFRCNQFLDHECVCCKNVDYPSDTHGDNNSNYYRTKSEQPDSFSRYGEVPFDYYDYYEEEPFNHKHDYYDYIKNNNRWSVYKDNNHRTDQKSSEYPDFGYGHNEDEKYGLSHKRGINQEENGANGWNNFEYTVKKNTATETHEARSTYDTDKNQYSTRHYKNNGQSSRETSHGATPSVTTNYYFEPKKEFGVNVNEEIYGWAGQDERTTSKETIRDKTTGDHDVYHKNKQKPAIETSSGNRLPTNKQTSPSIRRTTTTSSHRTIPKYKTTTVPTRTTSSRYQSTTKETYSILDKISNGAIIFEDTFQEIMKGKTRTTTEQTTKSNNWNQERTKKFCQTPDKKPGTCTRPISCEKYMTLQNNLDRSKKSVREYLNKFKCNQDEICCQNEKNVVDNSLVDTKKSKTNLPTESISEICGRPTTSTDRIVGGQLVSLGEFPWMALLQYPSNKGIQSGCGGALINSRYVVTAAHCVDERLLRNKGMGQVRQVVLGEYDTRNKTDCINTELGQDCADPAKIYRVESIITHNRYNRNNVQHDIALIKLDQNVAFSDYIKPICLPSKKSTLMRNTSLTIAGWGETETETFFSPVMRKAKIPFVDKQNCNSRIGRVLTEGQICAGYGNGTDSCRGDSGGPLMAEIGFKFESVTYLMGVISYGIGRVCGIGPSVNTYVPYYVDWINSNVR